MCIRDRDKPWIEQGVNGVHHFVKKLWIMYFYKGYFLIEDSFFSTSLKEYKIVHNIIKKIREDMGFISFNTTISAFMIVINELSAIKCRRISILEPIVILIAPFAPHISEELWHYMGYKNSVSFNPIPITDDKLISEEIIQYAIMFDGKFSFKMHFSYEVKEKYIIDRALNHPKMIENYNINNFFKVIFIPYLVINIIVSR